MHIYLPKYFVSASFNLFNVVDAHFAVFQLRQFLIISCFIILQSFITAFFRLVLKYTAFDKSEFLKSAFSNSLQKVSTYRRKHWQTSHPEDLLHSISHLKNQCRKRMIQRNLFFLMLMFEKHNSLIYTSETERLQYANL